MKTLIKKTNTISSAANAALLVKNIKSIPEDYLIKEERTYLQGQLKQKKKLISFNRYDSWIFVQILGNEKENYKNLEEARKAGCKLTDILNDKKLKNITIVDIEGKHNESLAFTEGLALGNYQFYKYLKKTDDRINTLKDVKLFSSGLKKKDLDNLNTILESIYKCRDLINEPVSFMTAKQLAGEIQAMGKDSGAKVEVMNKKKIEALQMGGLLAVNKGSVDPPTFTIIEWKPDNAVNKKPYVFVGKGIVYDTGGLNIKTGKYMEDMKADMSGAAAVAATVFAIAKAKFPVHIIGLIPSTDNRPNGNAYASGDVIKMHSGSTVEVINTDAEGRMILADALSYAKKFDPELVIDLATLTGSAVMAIGQKGIVAMCSKALKEFEKLKKSGLNVYERIVELPLWDEYQDDLKSNIADIKNLGGPHAGAITAGKFLEHFTDYPYIHLDIAGPAFLNKKDSYRGIGGSGVGVRLLFDFMSKL